MDRLSRRIGAATLALSLGLLSSAAVSPADAQAGKCASKGEYDKLKVGQTRTKVKQILDGQKVATGALAPGGESYEQYETCGWSAKYVTLRYEGGLGTPYVVKSKAMKPFFGSVS
jgi:hypothetical protein